MLHQVIDRRLSGKNKSIGNRERFLRRYRDQIREAVRKAVGDRSIRDIEEGTDITLPKRDVSEPVFGHGPGGTREMVHPGNQEYVRGDQIPRPAGRRRRRRRQRRVARRQRRGRLRLPDHARRVHELLLRRPGAAAPDPHPAAGRCAGVEDAARRLRLARATRPACTWCARCAWRWAGASRWAATPASSCASSKSTWSSWKSTTTRRRPRSRR